MHVCLLTSGRIFEPSYGGEEKFTLAFAEWLFNQKHIVTIIGSTFMNVKVRTLSHEEIKPDSVPPRHVRTLNPPYLVYMLSRLVLTMLWVLRIWSLHRRIPITILHAQDTGYAGLAAVIAGKLLRMPVIITTHGIRHRTLAQSLKGKLSGILLKLEYRLDVYNLRNADAVVAVSHAVKQDVQKMVEREVVVIPIGIKVKDFQFSESNRSSVRSEFGIAPDQKIIGYVGRLVPEKNLFTLLSAFIDACQSIPSLKLVIVGSGPLETEMKSRIGSNGYGQNTIFCGGRSDIGRILSAFDVFVLPSLTEGLPTALLEAMAAGKSIICSKIDANAELLEETDAIFFDASDSKALSSAIQLLCTNNKVSAELARSSRLKADRYDEQTVFSSLLEFYDSVLESTIKTH